MPPDIAARFADEQRYVERIRGASIYPAVQNVILACRALGLGTTMIGAAAPIVVRRRGLCLQLGIPDGNRPSIALIVGYPATHFRRGITRHFSSVRSFG